MFLFISIPILTRTILIAAITLLTLLGIMTRPLKLNEAVFALVEAGLLLILGLISPVDPVTTLFAGSKSETGTKVGWACCTLRSGSCALSGVVCTLSDQRAVSY